MSDPLPGSNNREKFEALSKRTYKEQAIWFLNAQWDKLTDEQKKLIWDWKHKCDALDLEKKNEGNELDELNAHRLLEFFHQTMTVQEMRESLRKTGAIGDRVKLVPLIHFLIVKFNVDYGFVVNAPQGNKKEIEEAQRRLEAVQRACAEAEEKAAAARAALKEAESREAAAKSREAEAKATEAEAIARENEAKRTEAEAIARENDAKAKEAEAIARENDAKNRENEAISRENELKTAQQELEQALSELKSQEDAYNNKTNDLKRKSEDESASGVARNRAKNELAQHLAEDPLPLRRAKITQEAAVKKADKATKAAAEARAAAEQARSAAQRSRAEAEAARSQAEQARVQAEKARSQAEQARVQAEQARAAAEKARQAAADAKHAAEEAVEEAQRQVGEAEAYLEEVKNRGGGEGAYWWIDQELEEAKKYMPTRKGGVAKKAVF